jgi:hypothetical protein
MLAFRVYPEPRDTKRSPYRERFWRTPNAMFVFDTETRIDATQRLTFGSYRFIKGDRCLEEGLFFADDLPTSERLILERYVLKRQADVHREGRRELLLLNLKDFLKKFYQAAYKGRALLVGFNLPFDLSRIAFDCSAARGRFAGGFSLGLWSYIDTSGRELPNHFRPRIGIKQIDSKRALKGFTSRRSPDREDLVFEEASANKEEGSTFRGHFLDGRTVAFALTDKSYSLETACEDFKVDHGKQSVSVHGKVTEKYIDYNRRDVQANSELAFKLLDEYAKHPIPLQVTKAYSPASIGKSYLRAMGIKPILERQPNFPKEYLGFAQSAFFGGRTSAHIRKVPVPVVYTDFLSMYPTVNSLMDLWKFVIANEIHVVTDCQSEIEQFLGRLSSDRLFQPETWKLLTGFVKVISNGDILPSRAKYNSETNDWQVAVNHLYAEEKNPNHGFWYSLPDVAASVLLTGRVPKIVDAFRIRPCGVLSSLKSTALRGAVVIDPRRQDFFKIVIEERKRLTSRTDLSEAEKELLDKALKVLANAASYGIYAEMNRRELEKKAKVTCYGIDQESFVCQVAHPDDPGEYCFPPLASLITGGARLMLSLLEHRVSALGGTYAMEDTDSMAIVPTEDGGLIPCPGGQFRTPHHQEAVKALRWDEIRAISKSFTSLNPYSRDAIPESILKIEEDNFDPTTAKQRQLHCVAVSAKRYALFLLDQKGHPVLLRRGINNKKDRWSDHGLGHLLNPSDPESDDRQWTGQAWLRILRRVMRSPTNDLPFEDAPAIGRLSISSPWVMKPFDGLNAGKKYADQLKPFNFLQSCHISQLGHPIGTDPGRFHLVAPYESDPKKWLKADWFDRYSGERYQITTAGHHGTRDTARVKTYGEVLLEYEFHPEAKCADLSGNPCSKQSTGLLQRRHVRIGLIKYIGKESNSLEDVEAGVVHCAQSVYTVYSDPRRDEWQMKILPALRKMRLSFLVNASGISSRELKYIRSGRSRPHPKNRRILAALVQ